MAIGGDLQSAFPSTGINPGDVEVIGSANHDEIAALPNEQATIIVTDEDGHRLSPNALPASSDLGILPGSSQDILAVPAGSFDPTRTSKDSKAIDAPGLDLEKQAQALPDGFEARLDFSTVDLTTRQALLLKCTKALLAFGAPSHRVEADLDFAAEILAVPAQFVHNPNCVVVNFGNAASHLSDTVTVKHVSGGLDLGSLHKFTQLWRSLEAGTVTVKEATLALEQMMEAKPIYKSWQRIAVAATMSGLICPMAFSGSFADAMLAALFAGTLTWLKLCVAVKNQRFGDVFEIVAATCVSFVAKGLSRIGHIFCYEATLSSGLVGILPGFIILAGSLELAGRNLVGGAVRMVYAVIYSLFLGFGIGVGSDLYGLVDRSARHRSTSPDVLSFSGSLINGTTPFVTGSFTFTNGTSTLDASTAAINSGNIQCNRAPTDGWYARPLSNEWYLFLLVPTFAVLLAISNLQPVKRREMLVMVLIACAGWTTNHFAGLYIHNRSDNVSCIGGLTVGVLANLYGRITRSSAFVVGISGILFLVPSGVAAAGGLVISGRGQSSDGSVYAHSLGVGLLMVEIAIGITVGLFFSSFLAHIFNSKRSKLNDHLRAFSF